MRIILEAKDHIEAQECLRRASHLIENDYRDCVYQNQSGLTIWAKRTITGVSARVMRKGGDA